jgi:hypothetical protein
MQRNKVHHVHTVGRVAKDLGVDEDLIHELTRTPPVWAALLV